MKKSCKQCEKEFTCKYKRKLYCTRTCRHRAADIKRRGEPKKSNPSCSPLSKSLEYTMWNKAKHRAKVKGMDFNLKVEDITIPDVCPLLGIPLFTSKKHAKDNSPSLDRIDNNKGYTRGNILVISFKANRIKSTSSLEDLELLTRNLKTLLSSVPT